MPDIDEQIRDATERVLLLLLGILITTMLIISLNRDIGSNPLRPLVPNPKSEMLNPRQI